MDTVSKSLIIFGILLIVGGLIWHFSGGKIPLGHLPGDIHIQTGNSKIFIPITSCIVVSVLLSLISWLFRR